MALFSGLCTAAGCVRLTWHGRFQESPRWGRGEELGPAQFFLKEVLTMCICIRAYIYTYTVQHSFWYKQFLHLSCSGWDASSRLREVASFPPPATTPSFLASSHFFGTSFLPPYPFFSSPSCTATLFCFVLDLNHGRLSGCIRKAGYAGLPSTMIGVATHLTVMVICPPLGKTQYIGTGPSWPCQCSTTPLYAMTDGSDGANYIISALRP